MKKTLIISLLAVILGCDSNEPTDEASTTKFEIESTYQTYVDAFFAEAKLQGWGDLPKNNLIVKTVNDETIPGIECRQIEVQYTRTLQEDDQWIIEVNELLEQHNRDQVFIESVIFMEMAHIFLSRPYTENAFNMMSYCNLIKYTAFERDDVLDKLFAKDYEIPPTVVNANEEQYTAVDAVYSRVEELGFALPVIQPEIKFTFNNEFTDGCDNSSFYNSMSYKTGNTYTIEIYMGYVEQNAASLVPMVLRELAHLALNKPYSQDQFTEAGDNVMYRCNMGSFNDDEIAYLFN